MRLRAAATAACALLLAFAAGLGDPSPAGADSSRATQVMIAMLPQGTSPSALAADPRIAPGILSAGIGAVPPAQTYLDIGQGDRVSQTLYDAALPSAVPARTRVPGWGRILARADSAPADIVPGLLASTLRAHRLPTVADGAMGLPALLAADRGGLLLRSNVGPSAARCPGAVCVLEAKPAALPGLIRSLRGNDLLIALERPPPQDNRQLTIGIAGRGFDGNLTSDSTRMRGYVLSTDIAPTVLGRLGVPIPSQMLGQPIRSEGGRDVGAVVSLGNRLASIIHRRGPVIGGSVLIWFLIGATTIGLSRGALARPTVRMVALSGVLLPAMLLIGAAVQPSLGVERLILVVGAPLIAALVLRLLPGYRALLFACTLTLLAFAIDVIAGSPLTPLSLIGPDPGLGVRFYGIGNELEAVLTPLVLAGIGVAITVFAPDLAPRRAASVFLVGALVFAFVFAFGRFGADVGAAITLPAGAAAAVAALGATRRSVLLVIAVPAVTLIGLALLDLSLGGNAHLTRSVLDVGGLHDLGKVAERRLRLSAHSFKRGVASPFFWLTVAVIAGAIYERQRILAWFDPVPALRAGFVGAAFAVLVATLANDSGALLLELGTLYLLLIAGFAWSQEQRSSPTRGPGGAAGSQARAA